MRRIQSVLLLLCLAGLLTGCGFQLRTVDISSLGAVSLSGAAAAPAMYRELADLLDSQDVATRSTDPDAISVVLLDERTIRRSVATTSLIDAAEYELRLEVDMQISRGSESLAADTLVAQRVFAVDAINLSASTEEQRLLVDEMRRELSASIVRQVEIITASP